MALVKDDPVYYKKKIADLIKQARKSGLEVTMNKDNIINFKNSSTGECATSYIPWLFKEENNDK